MRTMIELVPGQELPPWIPKQPKTEGNDPRRAGQYASNGIRFGEFGRYRAQAVHTRFEDVVWFVFDAERPESDGMPGIIRQAPDFISAVNGLI